LISAVPAALQRDAVMVAEEIAHPEEADWGFFCDWADAEGWRVPENEIRLLQGPYADDVFVLRRSGRTVGFVCAVRHARTSWIGNLIVPQTERGKGYGAVLFDHALSTLLSGGVPSVWLTASEMGRPIYERRGFGKIDRIVRWTAKGHGVEDGRIAFEEEVERLVAEDARAWGGRGALLRGLGKGGEILRCGGASALLQRAGSRRILGPAQIREWRHKDLSGLIDAALKRTPCGEELVLDAPEGAGLSTLLKQRGFSEAGGTALMARGDYFGVDLRGVLTLATLGSIG